MNELYNDLVSRGNKGLPEVWDKKNNLLVSDTSFRSLIPPHIKYMTTKYKQMCACEICVMIKSLQHDLNQYRLSTIRLLKNRGLSFDPLNNLGVKTNSYDYRDVLRYPLYLL